MHLLIFEKAIDFASDTMRIILYAQRADMHVFRQEFKEAVADYDRSISLADRFSNGTSTDNPVIIQQIEQPAVLATRGRAHTKGKLGQMEAALTDIERATQKATGGKSSCLKTG